MDDTDNGEMFSITENFCPKMGHRISTTSEKDFFCCKPLDDPASRNLADLIHKKIISSNIK
jgi:hypothetical protein